jgi:sporulation protein YqfC
MRAINKLRTYILEDEFRINILQDKINIINFTKIGSISETSIEVYNDDNKIVINGKNLVISKLLNNEMLITGIIKSVELR